MANIRVNLDCTIKDGTEVVFRSPCDCTEITGLIVYYIAANGSQASKVFALADAHGENVGDIPHLFASDAVVKVILDVTSGMAFVQNADTNAYLEGRFAEIEGKIEGGSGGMGGADWNASEGEPGHVLNRTHWVEGGMVEVLAETTLAGTDITTPFELKVGETYTVRFNGVEYTCVCAEQDAGGGVNLPAVTAEPFLLFNVPADMVAEVGMYGLLTPLVELTAAPTLAIYHNAETVHKLDPKFLPDGYPYAVSGMTELLAETEATSFTHPSFGTMWGIYDGAPNLKVGETYTIVYNGTLHKCVCQAAPAGLIQDPNAVAMGNFSVVGGANTGEPFAMLISYTYQEVDVIDLTGSTSVTISIMGEGEIVHKFDPKFLPDGIPSVFTVTAENNVPSATYQQIVAKAKDPNCIVRAFVSLGKGATVILPLVACYPGRVMFGNGFVADSSNGKTFVTVEITEDNTVNAYIGG